MKYIYTWIYYAYLTIRHSLNRYISFELINHIIHKNSYSNNEESYTQCFLKSKWIFHREDDLPSYKNNNKHEWYKNGSLHRDNGKPAILFNDFSNFDFSMNVIPLGKKYYLNNKQLNNEEINSLIIKNKIGDF
jgi:hypothetical protein